MDPLRPGDPQAIGPWTLVARLGSGGMGVVYLAKQGDQTVALKVVRSHFLDDPTLRERFTREVESLWRVRSSHVARVIGADTESEIAWVATEYVDGPTLKALVEGAGPAPVSDWFTLARGMALALQDIHDAGVVHRDIKPANVLISADGPRLIDFGIAQIGDATSLTMTGLIAGSPAWLSPEQVDSNVVGPESDFFSLGSVLAFAATGRAPWGPSGTPTPVVLSRLTTGEPDLEGTTAVQRQIIESLLQRDPSQRAGAQQILELLPAAPPLSIPPLPVPPTTPVVAASPPTRPATPLSASTVPAGGKRGSRLPLLVTGIALVLVTGLILLILNIRGDDAVDITANSSSPASAEFPSMADSSTTQPSPSASEPPDPPATYQTLVNYKSKSIPDTRFDGLSWRFDVCTTDKSFLTKRYLTGIKVSQRAGDEWKGVKVTPRAERGGRCPESQVNLTFEGAEKAPATPPPDGEWSPCRNYRAVLPETPNFARTSVEFCVRLTEARP